MEKKIILVDLDGVLFRYNGWKGIQHFGKPIKENIEMVKQLYKEGHHLLLYTTRLNFSYNRKENRRVGIVREQLKKYGINQCFESFIEGKPYFDLLWDDRSVSTRRELEKKIEEK